MPITIHNPQPAAPAPRRPRAADIDMDVASDSDSDSETGGAAIQGDIPMLDDDESIAQLDEDDEDEEQGDARDEILTPGTVITSNSQWMRYGYSYLSHLCHQFHQFPYYFLISRSSNAFLCTFDQLHLMHASTHQYMQTHTFSSHSYSITKFIKLANGFPAVTVPTYLPTPPPSPPL
jgi:hypothetical protein